MIYIFIGLLKNEIIVRARGDEEGGKREKKKKREWW